MFHTAGRWMALAIWGLIATTAAAAHGALYLITDLGTLSGSTESHPQAINDFGVIAGYCSVGQGTFRAFRWSAGTMTKLPGLTSEYGVAYDINSSGVIVGKSGAPGFLGDAHATLWSVDNIVSDIRPPKESGSEADAINAAGQIAGWQSSNGLYYTRGFLRSTGGVYTDMGAFDGPDSTPDAINAAGVVVGTTGSNFYAIGHAFRWVNGTMTILSSLGGNSVAHDINSTGEIVGMCNITNGRRAVRWSTDGTIANLGTLGGYATSANAINDFGQIVGFNAPDAELKPDHAFLFSNDQGMKNLDSLISSNPGWVLREATDINNRGQIVGWGINPSGQTHGFLLTPVPEPRMMLAVTLCGGAMMRRRRI